jgi:hypothetical protein
MGKMFQNASSLKPLGQLEPNCSGMIIGRSYLGFSIGIKNRNFVQDHPMIIPGKLGFNCLSGFKEEPF